MCTRAALITSAVTEAKERSVIDQHLARFRSVSTFCDVFSYIKPQLSVSLQCNADGDDHVVIYVGGNWRTRPSVLVSDRVETLLRRLTTSG